MKNILIFVGVILVFSISCRKDYLNDPKDQPTKWRNQLNKTLKVGNDVLKPSLIRMVDFRLIGEINSNEKKSHIENVLLDKNEYIPKYSIDRPNHFSLIKFKDVSATNIARKPSSGLQVVYDIQRTKQYLDTAIKVGQRIVLIDWQYKGKSFSTKAIVSDKNGVIYDNILTNILILHIDTVNLRSTVPENVTPYLTIDDCIPMPPADPFIYPRQYTLNHVITADWIWGGERGRAESSLFVEGYTDETMGYKKQYLTCASPTATCQISIGTCDAQIHETEFDAGQYGHVEAKYGMYLASPTVTVSMTYSPQVGFQISSSGLGSMVKQASGFYFSSNYWNTL